MINLFASQSRRTTGRQCKLVQASSESRRAGRQYKLVIATSGSGVWVSIYVRLPSSHPYPRSLYSNHSAGSYLTQPSSSSPGSPPAMSAAFKAFLNSPVGPKTTHFWGPVSNWGIILAVRAPVDSIGVSSSHSLPGVLFVLTTLASPLAATRENSSSRS